MQKPNAFLVTSQLRPQISESSEARFFSRLNLVMHVLSLSVSIVLLGIAQFDI